MLPLHHKLPLNTSRAGVDVHDVRPGGEGADVGLGAGVADGLDKEQLAGEIGDGHCVDKQVFRTLNDNGLRKIFVIKSSFVANWLKRGFYMLFLADFSL